MTHHQKRLSVPKSWPVERKTETFTVKADAGPHGEAGVPLLILLRDVLGYVDNRKEARFALDQDNVIINGTPVSDEERPVGMFDIVAFDEREEYYRVFPDEGGRLMLTPIAEDAAQSKLGKIDGKRHVPGGDVQLTLHDGHTLLVEEDSDYDVGDSIVIGNEDDEIVAHFEYEEGALATAVAGKHAGRIGTIDEIQVTSSSAENNVLLESDDGGFETVEDYIVIIDENFTSDDESAADDEPPAAEESAETDEPPEDGDAEESEADDVDESAPADADDTGAADDVDESAAEDAADTEGNE